MANIIELMDKYEGAGNYDTLYNFAQARPDSTFQGTKITDMTIGEVLDMQSKRGEGSYFNYVQQVNPENRGATPVGKYQFTGTTLNEMVDKYGIDKNAKFDKETQDKLFIIKAKERLNRSERLGTSPEEEFRKEWVGFKKVPDEELNTAISGLSDILKQPTTKDTGLGVLNQALQGIEKMPIKSTGRKGDVEIAAAKDMIESQSEMLKTLGRQNLFQLGRGRGPESNKSMLELIANKINRATSMNARLLGLASAKAFRGDADAGQLFTVASENAKKALGAMTANYGNMQVLLDEQKNPGTYDQETIDRAKAGLRGSFGMLNSKDQLFSLAQSTLANAQSEQLVTNQLTGLAKILQLSNNPDVRQQGTNILEKSALITKLLPHLENKEEVANSLAKLLLPGLTKGDEGSTQLIKD